MASEKNLSDFETISYPITVFQSKTSDIEEESSKVDPKTGAIIAKFGEVETLVRYDSKHGEVWARCTCSNYADLEPCDHIVAVYNKHIKDKVVEEESEKKDADKPKEPREDVKNQEEAKKKVLQKMTAMQKQQQGLDTEQQLILKADDMDEEIAIKEYLEGSEPLVYRIKTSKGQKLVLSIRGWTQAMLYQGNIEIVDVKFEEVSGKSIAKAIVRDTRRNIQQIGIAERYTREEFKWTTLASKAIRNALKKIISPTIEQRVIREALEAKQTLNHLSRLRFLPIVVEKSWIEARRYHGRVAKNIHYSM